MRLRRAALAALAAGTLLALPGEAGAAVNCSHVGDTVTITATAGESVTLRRPFSGSQEIDGTTCSPEPTTADTDVVNVNGAVSVVYDLFFGQLPIVINVNGGQFRINGSTFGNFQVAGANGVDLNGAAPAEINFTNVDQVHLAGNGTSVDTLSTAGTPALGGPFNNPASIDARDGNDTITAATETVVDGGNGNDTINATGRAIINGDAGNDTITGGEQLFGQEGDDRIFAGAGQDIVDAGEGDDLVVGGAGNDIVDGGPDEDIAGWNDAPGNVNVDLAIQGNTTQATGDGTDLLRQMEGLRGGSGDDTLKGIAGAETLDGGGGDDTLVERGGADVFIGGEGFDTATYAALTTALVADLAAGTAQAGGATDTLGGVEALIGGTAGDTLAGTPAADSLSGGGGNDEIDPKGGSDSVDGGAGDDRLALRDDAPDTAACGAGSDSAVADRDIDALTDCETVDLPPPVVIPPPACVPVTEIPGNGLDENCDGVDAQLEPVPTTIANAWRVKRRRAALRKLIARSVPAGTEIVVRCKGDGCPFRRKKEAFEEAVARFDLLDLLGGKRKLPVGTRLVIGISAPNALDKRVVFAVKAGKTPRPATTCTQPDGGRFAC